MKNITSRADVFPFPRSFLDHLSRRTKIELRCRCFVNFFCGHAVLVIFFCGVAVLTVPQCPPPFECRPANLQNVQIWRPCKKAQKNLEIGTSNLDIS